LQSDLVPWSMTLHHIPKKHSCTSSTFATITLQVFLGKMLLWTSRLNFPSSSSENKSSIQLKSSHFTCHLQYRWTTSIEPPWSNISAQYTFVILSQLKPYAMSMILSQLKPYAMSRHVLVLYMYEVFHSTCHPCRGVLCKEITKQIWGIMNNLQQSLMKCTACSAETKEQQWSILNLFCSQNSHL